MFKEFSIQQLDFGFSGLVIINNGRINIKIANTYNNKSLYFACYFLVGNKVIHKTNYNNTGDFNFHLDKSAHLDIKIYVKDKTENVVKNKRISLGFIFVESTYHQHLIGRLSNKLNFGRGFSLFNEQILEFPTFAKSSVSSKAIYSLDPFSNRTWRWYLHQLDHIQYLFSYYHLDDEKNELILKDMFDYISCWNDYKRSSDSDNDLMLWHDHASALRLRNLAVSFSVLSKSGMLLVDSVQYKLLINLIYEHIVFLSKDEFYSKFTNHGFDQSLFLYYACLEFEYLIPELETIKVLAQQRILDEINYAFCPDGGHKENSPAYLNFGIKQCLMVLEMAKHYHQDFGGKLDNLNEMLDRSTMALLFTIKPDGYLPLIGDTSKYKVLDLFNGYHCQNYPYFKYAVTAGKKGDQPAMNYLVLPETGYAYYRSTWEKDNFTDAVYLTFKASFHSNYHRHDDDLSITLYAYGEDWLIDGGIYKYDERNPHRRYIRSHLSHNLFSPNNVKALRSKSGRHLVELQKMNDMNSDTFHVLGTTAMYEGYITSREIHVINQEIIIKDTCSSQSENLVDGTSRLFFPHDKEIEVVSNTIYVKGKNKTLTISIDTHQELHIDTYTAHKSDVKGWLSDSNNALIPTKIVEIGLLEISSSRISLIMNFSFS
ncbi:heparinase II/III family protein [Acinetobacter sp. TTH0-4]|uniref:heparinase II/III domain-containing protein n=1 Tax=Acinetobacter sp. TTH0-4 TaxID=1646498 RepID=UPI0018A10F8F|nr:heparinase II/III family protein [Acinetobacter sp. TTH0-4]QPF37856.1 heparinase II/III family protein [Acinetobacter sp. TTH0-4]